MENGLVDQKDVIAYGDKMELAGYVGKLL